MFDLKKWTRFLQTDIWKIQERQLSRKRYILVRYLKVLLLAVKGFQENQCLLRASALTFYTLLSIVPVMAMAFGIAKGFGLESVLERHLFSRWTEQQEALNQIITFSRTLLENTKGGVIAGIGVAGLFWTVIKLLNHIEFSFNAVWGIKTQRGWLRKFSDYLSLVLICPLLLIISSSTTLLIAHKINMAMANIGFLNFLQPVTFVILGLLPFITMWILFSFIYIYIPNTKVNVRSALTGGIAAGTAYQIMQWAYIFFQVGAAKYGAIYGSFAALPLFLLWLQASWLIVLFGAEVSFADQNEETYESEPSPNVNYSLRKILALWMTEKCIKNFIHGEKPLSESELSRQLNIPSRLSRNILNDLVEGGILSEIKTGPDEECCYQPARSVEALTIQYVIERLEKKGHGDISVKETEELLDLKQRLEDFNRILENSEANVALKDIARDERPLLKSFP